MFTRIGIPAAFFVFVSLLACGRHTQEFAPVGSVTTANLWVNAKDGSRYGWKMSDPKALSRIAAFVDSQRTNWATPWYGIPLPFVKVELFDGNQAKGSFGAGTNFFESARGRGFFSKNATPNEIRAFFNALNLDDAQIEEIRNGADGTGSRN